MFESMAHELRTPLNSIIGNNEFLFEIIDEEGFKYLESSQNSAIYMIEFIDSFVSEEKK